MAEHREVSRAPMTDFNVLELASGARVQLNQGATAEVVSNPRDGMWVLVRFLTCSEDPSQEGNEELVFAEDIEAVL